jgi:hypothetical protein
MNLKLSLVRLKIKQVNTASKNNKNGSHDKSPCGGDVAE